MTTVTLADGSKYPIPTGAPGTAAWAREASLIAVAYRQAGDFANADKWQREYGKRWAAYLRVQQGEDLQAVIRAGSWLDGPAAILAYLAKTVKDITDVAVGAGRAVVDWGRWLPWLVGGGLIVLGIAVYQGTIPGIPGGRRRR
jgi:hypothetical protein